MELRAHPSLHSTCYHQLIFAKFNLKNFYLPPYSNQTWHYQRTNTDHIRQVTSEFALDVPFASKDMGEKDLLFNRTITNILSNYVLHETVFCDDRNSQLMIKKIKKCNS